MPPTKKSDPTDADLSSTTLWLEFLCSNLQLDAHHLHCVVPWKEKSKYDCNKGMIKSDPRVDGHLSPWVPWKSNRCMIVLGENSYKEKHAEATGRAPCSHPYPVSSAPPSLLVSLLSASETKIRRSGHTWVWCPVPLPKCRARREIIFFLVILMGDNHTCPPPILFCMPCSYCCTLLSPFDDSHIWELVGRRNPSHSIGFLVHL